MPRGRKHKPFFEGTEAWILAPEDEAFCRAYVLSRTGSIREAAIAAGWEPSNAHNTGRRALNKPGCKRYIRELMIEAGVQPIDVMRVLARQLLNSFEDFLTESGSIDLEMARERGVLDQIKSISYDQYGNVSKIELYSSQAAAKILSANLGMEKAPETHPVDAQREDQRRRALVELAMKELTDGGHSPVDAAYILIEKSDGQAEPYVKKYITESSMIS